MLKRMLTQRVFDLHAPLGTPHFPSLEFEYSGLWGGKITFYQDATPCVLMSLSGWEPQSSPSFIKSLPDPNHYSERSGPLIERAGQTLRLVIHVLNNRITLVNRDTYCVLLQLPLPHNITQFTRITAQNFEYIYSVDSHIKHDTTPHQPSPSPSPAVAVLAAASSSNTRII